MVLDNLTDIKDAQDLQGRTALHSGAELGLCEIFKQLLSGQANPLLKDSTGRTVFHYAAMDWNNTPDIIPTLLDYAGINVPDDDGRMPLHYAADLGCPLYIKLLSPSTHLAAVDSRGQTALQVAAHGSHLQAVQELLACNVERRELSQATMDAALHLAASLGNLQIVQALVDHGAGVWHRDSSGKTAVEIAVEQKNAPLAMYLVELVLFSSRGEVLPPGWIQVARTCPLDDDDPSALCHAMSRNYQNAALALIEDEEDIFKTGATGVTVLSLAVGKMATTVIRALMDKYAHAIQTAKQLEEKLWTDAASRGKRLTYSDCRSLPERSKDVLWTSWTAVLGLDAAFNSTNDPELRRLLTSGWPTLCLENLQKKALSMGLTPSRPQWIPISSSEEDADEEEEEDYEDDGEEDEEIDYEDDEEEESEESYTEDEEMDYEGDEEQDEFR